jgi:uncharacterized protein (UPF0147 family)
MVDKRLGGRKRYGKRLSGSRGLFPSGFLVCKDEKCGCSVVYEPKSKKRKSDGDVKLYKYYRCTNAKSVHSRKKYVPEEEILSGLLECFDDFSIDGTFAKQIESEISKQFKSTKARSATEIGELKSKLSTIVSKEQKTIDLMVSGTLTEEQGQMALKQYEVEKTNLVKRLEIARMRSSDSSIPKVKEILEVATNAKSIIKMQDAEKQVEAITKIGVPYGSRTRVFAVKGRCPRPLDEGNLRSFRLSKIWSPAMGSNHGPSP